MDYHNRCGGTVRQGTVLPDDVGCVDSPTPQPAIVPLQARDASLIFGADAADLDGEHNGNASVKVALNQRHSRFSPTCSINMDLAAEGERLVAEIREDALVCDACGGTGLSAHFMGVCRHCAAALADAQEAGDVTEDGEPIPYPKYYGV